MCSGVVPPPTILTKPSSANWRWCTRSSGSSLARPRSVTGPARRVAAVMQAGQYRDALVAQQFEMQGIRKPSQQDPAKAIPCGRKGLWVARQLFFGRCEHAQKIATQTVGFLFVPIKGFGNFGLRRRFKNDPPGHRRTPSDCAIWARLLPCAG